MNSTKIAGLALGLALLPSMAFSSEVLVIGQMRRMFLAHDVGPNIDLSDLSPQPHLYALGPVAGLRGEITVADGVIFVSKAAGGKAVISLDPAAKAVFLVYASVPAWHSISLPTNVVTETDLADFLAKSLPADSRSAFLVQGTVANARYHIENYLGRPEDLTHEAHDKAKVLFDLTNTPARLVGFFSNRDEDGGSFVHQGQTTHIHILSDDHKSMGHLESVLLQPGATLLLPKSGQ